MAVNHDGLYFDNRLWRIRLFDVNNFVVFIITGYFLLNILNDLPLNISRVFTN